MKAKINMSFFIIHGLSKTSMWSVHFGLENLIVFLEVCLMFPDALPIPAQAELGRAQPQRVVLSPSNWRIIFAFGPNCSDVISEKFKIYKTLESFIISSVLQVFGEFFRKYANHPYHFTVGRQEEKLTLFLQGDQYVVDHQYQILIYLYWYWYRC